MTFPFSTNVLTQIKFGDLPSSTIIDHRFKKEFIKFVASIVVLIISNCWIIIKKKINQFISIGNQSFLDFGNSYFSWGPPVEHHCQQLESKQARKKYKNGCHRESRWQLSLFSHVHTHHFVPYCGSSDFFFVFSISNKWRFI